MSHTKEPWSLKEVANYSGRIKYLVPVDSENMSLLTIVENERAVFPAICEDEDARRIVACVNACAGIKTEMLEAMPSGPASLVPMYAELEKQRDELLAALGQFAAWGRMQHKAQSKGCHATFDMLNLKDEIDLAEAVIASVKCGG